MKDKQKNKAKVMRQQALHWLAQQFPEAFNNTVRIRPLKIGILSDILAHAADAEKKGISKTKLREAVVLYTRRIDYLTCIKNRENRIDLFGQSTGAVSEEDAKQAALKIKKRVEKACHHIQHAPRMHTKLTVAPSAKLHDPQQTKPNPSIIIKRKFTAPTPSITHQLREKLDLEESSF